MRTPNTKCSICEKPLYRRPSEFKNCREFCCIGCRSELYKKRKPSPNLELGRQKGLIRRGHKNTLNERRKRSESAKLFWQTHPEALKRRGLKRRRENKITPLYLEIRTSPENRRWINKTMKRDVGVCQVCGDVENIEVHHKIKFAHLVKTFQIKTIDDAVGCKALWDINNGFVVCRRCHYALHNKKYNEN